MFIQYRCPFLQVCVHISSLGSMFVWFPRDILYVCRMILKTENGKSIRNLRQKPRFLIFDIETTGLSKFNFLVICITVIVEVAFSQDIELNSTKEQNLKFAVHFRIYIETE